MFSGKSTELLRQLVIDSEIGLKVLYVNHCWDNRTVNAFSTHNPLYKSSVPSSNLTLKKVNKLAEIREDVKGYDVIGIDEGQFFEDLLEIIPEMVDGERKKVIIAGLDSDYKRQQFGQIINLIPLADSVIKLLPYCKLCVNQQPRKLIKAPFTYRHVDQDEVIAVGGADKYMPLCRDCYLELSQAE